ncbi:MAG: hypothetical protein J7L15_04005 [Clostridiales bacterium]|nr:hypothetical protein [Clostridiales bacterium]
MIAASDLARGKNISIKPIPDEVTYFVLAKEFGWTPQQVKEQNAKDIKAITVILSSFNKTESHEIKMANKKRNKSRR